MGGPIAQLSAPAKGAPRTQNKFESLQEDKKEEEPKPESKGPPKFVGSLKGLLSRQNQDNAEANKNLPEIQKKLAEQIKIHDAKPPRKEGEQGEQEQPRHQEGGRDRKREGGDFKPYQKQQQNEDEDDDSDGFEQVEEERKRGGDRRGGRGGARGGRGGFNRDDDQEPRRGGDRPKTHHGEERPQKVEQAPKTTTAAPKKEEVKIPIPAQRFSGWGESPLF